MSFKRITICIILVLLLVIAPFILAKVAHAQEQAQSASTDMSDVTSKLDHILNNQRAIMDQIASMKEELRVIKIRVTQAQ